MRDNMSEWRDGPLPFILLALAILFGTSTGVGVALMSWKRSKNAQKYLPLLNAAELRYGLPADLLARMAYQESRFRDDIVNGTTSSIAGARGIMQLVPKYHPNINPLNVPAAIDYAARFVRDLHQRFHSWPLAVAAYNAGPGNVSKYKGIPPFAETQNYVSQIFKDLLSAVPTEQHTLYA